MLKVHAAPSFQFLFSPFALAHPHHMHTHTHAAKRTPHSLQLQQCPVALQRICNCCCSFIANAIALKAVQTTTRRARNGPQGWWATVSNAHSPSFLLCTRALKRAPQAESHTAMQHCTHDRFCSALLLLSASAITAAPSVPMLLLRRLCTP